VEAPTAAGKPPRSAGTLTRRAEFRIVELAAKGPPPRHRRTAAAENPPVGGGRPHDPALRFSGA